jgi:hypothetical protein
MDTSADWRYTAGTRTQNCTALDPTSLAESTGFADHPSCEISLVSSISYSFGIVIWSGRAGLRDDRRAVSGGFIKGQRVTLTRGRLSVHQTRPPRAPRAVSPSGALSARGISIAIAKTSVNAGRHKRTYRQESRHKGGVGGALNEARYRRREDAPGVAELAYQQSVQV